MLLGGNNITNDDPMPVRAFDAGPDFITNGQNQSLTVSSTAVAFLPFPADTTHVWFGVKTADVNLRTDGTAPTSTVGLTLAAGTNYVFRLEMIEDAQFIRTGSTDANLFGIPLKLAG